jgi:hypothetical protein
MSIASMTIGSVIAFCLLIFVSWTGFKKYKDGLLWLGFVPIFSISHYILGWYILGLAFWYDGNPNQVPLFAKMVGPTYSGVILIGYPLEAIGLGDDLAYSIAFGLYGICIAVLIAFIVQWVKKGILIRKLNKTSN